MALLYICFMHTIAETPRLIVRECLPEEEEAYLKHFEDEEVCLHIPKRSRDERINIFRNGLADYATDKKLGKWGVFSKTNGRFIGTCLLRRFSTDEPGKIEIGYSFDRNTWGLGLGSEMVTAVVNYALSDENTAVVVGVTTLPNIASQRVLEKAGLKRMENIVKDGVELVYFSLVNPNIEIILQTPRLFVRRFLPVEETMYINLYQDEEVCKHLTKRSNEELGQKFKESLAEYENGSGLGRWGAFDNESYEFIGSCMLKPADSDPSRIELGYVLACKHWGKGMASEIAKALVDYGLNKKGLREICACTSVENVGSQNVLLKAGLLRDGNIFWHDNDLPFFRILVH
jgi:ribosomal-protein-alanine N-acetyltransferase